MKFDDGRLMKHPRAANFAWRAANGKFLYWFHNHGGRFIREHPRRRSIAYEDRNPVWLVGGVETDSPKGRVIRWTQPEIGLYEDDPMMRMSYPDLVEQDGKYYLTETEKEIARVHEVDRTLLEGLWNQFESKSVASAGLLLDLPSPGSSAEAPQLPAFLQRARGGHGTQDLRTGFSLDLWATLKTVAAGQTLLDNRTAEGVGFLLRTVDNGAVELTMNDGRTENRWASDAGALRAGQRHHIAVIVDGGPKIISFVVDGRFHDGGNDRQFGWGRYNADLRSAMGGPALRIGAGIERLRVYGRAIRISEAIGNWRAECRGC